RSPCATGSRLPGTSVASSCRDAMDARAATPSQGGADTRCAPLPRAPPPPPTPPPRLALAGLLHCFDGAPGTLSGSPEPGVRPAALAAEACKWPANSSAQGHGAGETHPGREDLRGLAR